MSGVFADALALVIAIAIAVLVAAVRARWGLGDRDRPRRHSWFGTVHRRRYWDAPPRGTAAPAAH